MIERVVILGAGQAGAQVALSLRQGGHSGELVSGRQLIAQRTPVSEEQLEDPQFNLKDLL